ncbi:uncharacterized protein LOC117121372 isoform X2 [Anneissia japonica]|uniref:uncharacterized protein LOC117121372 isoform X2 n=1 Tax=Anneissia japonica TaxID=1529436 RepID=UPI0014256FA1|nr:uncharacterized protein LOC117121372 isoform X2 [Anneissia japonica]
MATATVIGTKMSNHNLFSTLLILLTSMVVVTIETSHAPKGHMEPIGNHRDSDGHIEILTTVPHPLKFWEKYVKKGEPVLFRGAANHSPGLKLWTDHYLLENYGRFKVKVESKFEKYDTPVGVFGIGQESIKNFIGRYRADDIYIVSQLPDPMGKDVAVPPCLLCGTFRESITEANLWFSSGGTKSLLHRDADDAINCLYNGTKDWIMIHPRDEQNIPIAKEVFEGYGGFSVLDPDRVDLLKHPQFVNVPWKFVHVKAGDCLFLPRGYWHRVTSGGAKNIAVSLLFGRIEKFEPLNCDTTKLDFMPLTEVGTVWSYDGFGVQSMGNANPFALNETIQEMCLQSLQHRITVDDIYEDLMEDFESEDVRNLVFKDGADSYQEYVTDISKEYLRILGDTDQKGFVTCDEVKGITLDQLKEVSVLTSMDPANTEEMEYYTFSMKKIESFLMAFADGNEDSRLTSFEKFSDEYQRIGGTSIVAENIFNILDINSDRILTVQEIHANIGQVLQLYSRISVFDSGVVVDDVDFDFETELSNEIDQNFTPNESPQRDEL